MAHNRPRHSVYPQVGGFREDGAFTLLRSAYLGVGNDSTNGRPALNGHFGSNLGAGLGSLPASGSSVA
jgi:hypothetical protein